MKHCNSDNELVQVQYSLLDRRPENQMSSYCQQNGMTLTPYGTVAGGFLSERYLGVPASQCTLYLRLLLSCCAVQCDGKLTATNHGFWRAVNLVLRQCYDTFPCVCHTCKCQARQLQS